MEQNTSIAERRLKRVLCDIIDVAYGGEPAANIRKYKTFTISIESTVSRTFNGAYIISERRIRLVNLTNGAGANAKTCLHELAHHIDAMQNGRTGHQKPFYMAYAKLIYASLDMGITTFKDFEGSGSNDSRKVHKIVQLYSPRKVDYLPQSVIFTKGGFNHREELKQMGFRWNGLEKRWEKNYEGDSDDAFMKTLGISDYSVTGDCFHLNAVVTLVASGNTYSCKDVLKKEGFHYNATDKRWQKKIPAEASDNVLKQYQAKNNTFLGVTFSIQ